MKSIPRFAVFVVFSSLISSVSPAQSLPDTAVTHAPEPLRKYVSVRSMAVPVSMIGVGFASIHLRPLNHINRAVSEEVQEKMPGFATKVDDYLKHAPAATLFALTAVGVKGRHQLLGKVVVYFVSTEIGAEAVKRLKRATHTLRPDGSTYNSFPSGHTTTAFIGAEMIHQEYGSISPWYSIAGYTMASGTALLRVLNNRHWLGDVIAGAGLGILSTKLGYWLFSKVERKPTNSKLLVY